MAITMKRFAWIFSIVGALSAPPLCAADYLSMSGAQLYARFCASCHGINGRGDGPVASSIRVEVPDLTLLARRQGSAFKRERIERVVDGRFLIGAHGTREMPIWGENFSRVEVGDPEAERTTDLIIKKLVDHIEAMQRPAR